MDKRTFGRAILLALVPLCFLGSCAAQTPWTGTYTYVSSSGSSVGGSVLVTEYTLVVGSANSCSIRVSGYQVDENIECRLRPSGRRATVQFVSYADGNVKNELGVEEHAPDEVLFILLRDADRLSTEWAGLRPDAITENPGNYFKAMFSTSRARSSPSGDLQARHNRSKDRGVPGIARSIRAGHPL